MSIYSYYVENTAISFEYTTPSLSEFEERISNTLENYPYIVLEDDGLIRGYAYAGVFKGRALYEELESALKEMGIINLYACIGDPENHKFFQNNRNKAEKVLQKNATPFAF